MDSSRRRSAEEEEEEEEEEMWEREELSQSIEEEQEEEAWWLVTLETQVMGACRTDERSVPIPLLPLPLLRLRLSPNLHLCLPGPAALARLTQLFEVSEIGLLARCLCAPLLSIRVGKINRIGTLLCPIPSRGQLNLNMAPSSWLRISFVGDDGCTEQLGSINCNSSEVDGAAIEELAADTSGRSFVVKLSESQVFYYWLSEKSLSHGLHLLDKMKDILRRRPTLSELTGISSSRLDSLGPHWRACLVSPNLAESVASTSTSTSSSRNANARLSRPHHLRTATSTSTPTPPSSSSTKGGGSLSPRGNTCFKDGSSSSSPRDNKLKRRLSTDCNVGPLAVPSLPFNPPASTAQPPPSSGAIAGLSAGLSPEFNPFNPLTFQFPLPLPDHAIASSSQDRDKDKQPLFKPQYCWCPISPSRVPSILPPLPPIPSPVAVPSSLSLGTASSDLAKLLHDPLVHLPLPVSSLVIPPLPGSSQFPAFTGLMSDPIVHVPVMDMRSSGQAYLVSAGPAMSTAIPPLFVKKPLVPVAESVVEMNARETLMRLLESAPVAPNPICAAVTFGVDAFSSAFSSMEVGSSFKEDNVQEENEHQQEEIDKEGMNAA